jgi:hypothetical protein
LGFGSANFGWMALFLAMWHAPRLLQPSHPSVPFHDRLLSCLGDYAMVCSAVAAVIIITYKGPTQQRLESSGDGSATLVAPVVRRRQGPGSDDFSRSSRDDYSDPGSFILYHMGPRSLPSTGCCSDTGSSILLQGDDRISPDLVMETVQALNTIRGQPHHDRTGISYSGSGAA